MGARFTKAQKRHFNFVSAILSQGGFEKFEKKEIKQLIIWLSAQFPEVSPEQIHDWRFWGQVSTKLGELAKSGSSSLSRTAFWASQIRKVLKSQRKLSRKPSDVRFVPSSPCSLCSVPSPAAPERGNLKAAAYDGTAQKRSHCSDLFRNPPRPHYDSVKNTRSCESPVRFNIPPPSPPPSPPSAPLLQDSSQGARNGGHRVAPPSGIPSSQKTLLSRYDSFPSPVSPPAPLPSAPPLPPPDSTPRGTSTPASAPLPPPYHVSQAGTKSSAVSAPILISPPPSSPLSSGSHAPSGAAAGGAEGHIPEPPVLSAAPVTYQPGMGGGNQPQWSPFPHHSIKELCKAQKDFSRESEYFRGILRATLSDTVVTPADLRRLFSCLLNPTEFLVWEKHWQREIGKILPSLRENQVTATDLQGGVLTTDHLCGTGAWQDGQAQAWYVPVEALKEGAKAAERAFFTLRSLVAPLTSYMKIIQESNEPFLSFVERLRRAIETQVHDESIKRGILTEVAATNANPACKAAILSLPLDPPPTLDQMLDVCDRKLAIIAGEPDQQPRAPARRVAATDLEEVTTAAAAPSRQPNTPKLQPRTDAPCHLCNQSGHWMPDCPLRREFYEFKKKHRPQGTPQHQPKN
ncbi:protein Shroom3-like [Passer domesticus]|uniref:protein Shroom3-like n=1 Tax=Passer domesticus TaxID=48849 RepID=UPI0030FE5113